MTEMHPNHFVRKPLRAPGYEYRDAGFCFVTICTWKRQRLFGTKTNGIVFLNALGEKIFHILIAQNDFSPLVFQLETFAVMPDHIHLLIELKQDPSPVSIPEYVYQVKSFIQHEIKAGIEAGLYPAYHEKLWQRSFYDHVIRNEEDHFSTLQYIRRNPNADFYRAVENGEYVPFAGGKQAPC